MHYIYSDAGIDDSCQIVDEYIKNHYGSRIKFFKGIENKGQSFSRNFLIEQALADNRNYIAFLDADDKWLRTDHISSSLKLMRENISDVIYGRPRCFNDKGEEGHPFGMAIPKIFIGKQLEYLNYIWVSGVVCKAECFKNNPFDSTLDGLEDWDMWYRLFKQGFKFKPRDTLTFAYYDKFQGEATKSVTKMDLIRAKHKFDLTQTRLNVACGQDYQQGYINADLYEYTGDTKLTLDACFDAREIPYDDNTVDEIRALYIIEHFTFHEVAKVLGEWYRVLKPGGKLVLETPDFLESCRAFVNGDEGFRVHIYGHFFCFPWMPGQTHKFLFTETQLRTNLTWAGFKDITRISPMSNYVTSDIVNLFLAVEAFK
jgi:glycosyltransferase involved in cell wall biosynthesis